MNSILNPLLVQVMALGYLFNLYRGKPLLKKGGMMILTHPCSDEFDHEHHPRYIEFFNRLLPETRDAMTLEHKYEDEFAKNPSYIEMYRRGNAYHGAHPFFMWYWGENGRAARRQGDRRRRRQRARAEAPGLGAAPTRWPRRSRWPRAPSGRVARDHDAAPPADRHGGHGIAGRLVIRGRPSQVRAS